MCCLVRKCCRGLDFHLAMCSDHFAAESENADNSLMITQFALLALLTAPVAEPLPLQSRIQDLVADYKGKVAVACVHLKTREGYSLHADNVMPTASLVKL